MEELIENLKMAGLTGNESKVYVGLIKIGETSANELAKNLSLDRTLTYTILNHLIEKGMVGYVIKANKKFFSASEPQNLLNKIKKDETAIKRVIETLKTMKTTNEPSPKVNVYDGKEGLRTFLRLLTKDKKISAFGATGRLYDSLFETEAIAKELKKTLSARIIASNKYRTHPIRKIKRIEVRYLDVDNEATTTIFGDYIALHLLTDKPFIITIKNKEIAHGYLNYFNLLWKIAKK
ncbi:hypothetical protein J4217_04195 [Candidatus Pacearchaeota archaeon]|nr:hypothetical protein [Candidatus Pacearchaeota archaeon]